ncbi:50S ribosomal protein L11 methyltransferase [Bacteroidia bacterium]|nr:50S ribosomal protein L11 methyltransferase [Bacteroidia bacterium]
MSYTAVHILCDEDLEETVSFLLQENGYTGTSYEQGTLIAYCQSAQHNEESTAKLLASFNLSTIKIVEEEPKNWNQIWEDNFKDADLGEHIHSRAPFHPAKDVKHDIIVVPKMAFGTGHHETTRLSAISLEKLNCTNKSVLDMGCGSGLLAILASQKAAKRVLAIDYDIHSVENARENVQLNKAKNVEVVQADTVVHLTEKFDIIVSNIVKNINLRLLPEFVSKLHKDGHLILCGFIAEDLNELTTAASAHGLKCIEHNADNNWLQTQFTFDNNA